MRRALHPNFCTNVLAAANAGIWIDLAQNPSKYFRMAIRFVQAERIVRIIVYEYQSVSDAIAKTRNSSGDDRDSERELSLRRHPTRSTKYNRLVHKFRHRSTRLCWNTGLPNSVK